jgi:hypothetical protein
VLRQPGATAGRQTVFRIEVADPAGEVVLARNALLRNGRGGFTKSVALNARSGVWTVRARNVAAPGETTFPYEVRAE